MIETPEAEGDTTIASMPVAGALTAAQAVGLPTGATVCFAGAISGVKCGEKFSSATDYVMVRTPSQQGDSGGPVFVVFKHKVWLLGLASTSSNRSITATPIGNALARRGASALTAP